MEQGGSGLEGQGAAADEASPPSWPETLNRHSWPETASETGFLTMNATKKGNKIRTEYSEGVCWRYVETQMEAHPWIVRLCLTDLVRIATISNTTIQKKS